MMSDPKRLLDTGAEDNVGVFERELLSSLEPSQAERDLVLRRVMSGVGVAAGAGAVTTLSSKAAASAAGTKVSSLGLSVVAKVSLGFLAAAPVVFGGIYWATSSLNEEPAPRREVPKAQQSSPSEKAPESTRQETLKNSSQSESLPLDPTGESQLKEASAATGKKVTKKNPAPQPSSANLPVSAGSSVSTLAEENLLLRKARAAARSGNHQEALALVSEFERKYPKSVLRQERDLLRISILKKSGQSDQALQQAELFKKQYPDSPYDSTDQQAK